MKFIISLITLISFTCFAQATTWDGRIFNAKSRLEIFQDEYIRELSKYKVIVLGEKHYTPAVQYAQEQTIRNVVAFTNKSGAFTTAWEFLNVTAQNETDRLFNQVKSKEITAENFIESTQGKKDSGYASVIEATADLKGNLLGTNLSREEKKPVTENGIGALDPKLLPPDFDYGTRGYYERFELVMSGHATPEQIKNYYDSQCLVDDTIAYHLLKDSTNTLNFLIAGSFHTDFYDGAVHRMKSRQPGIKIVTVKIIDASDFEESELLGEMHSEQYGDVADYVYFVNNPISK
ncbi:MAG: ChaN family lipoprotein [Bacteriovorax sp.]|jgi:uncharacterized iron-regulated protein